MSTFNEFYQLALDEAGIVAITNAEGTIIYVNQQFCKISGYSKEELLGKNHRLINSGVMGKEFFKDMWKTISSGEIWKGDICNKAKDGSFYWVDTTIIPYKNPNGKVEKYIAFRRDITRERKQRKELENALIQAKQATRAKSNFLSTMSHEIRTPLNAIIGMTSLLLESKLTNDQEELASTISQAGKTLLLLIHDILDFSKIEAGKLDLEIAELNLNHYLKDLLKLFQYTAKKKGINFEVITNDYPYFVFCDEGRIGQIVSNLVSNAIKFTKNGGVRVEVLFTENKDMTDLVISVQDSGVGIPDDAKQRIFNAFYQAEQTTARNFGGTGLGLSIAKRLVETMGGQIGFESEYGKGTVFKVTLKLKTGKKTPKKETHFDHEISHEKQSKTLLSGRILVAEDNVTNQKVIARMLEKLGLRYHLVANGNEVLDSLRDTAFDLILMDCQMPEMNGYEATKKIRNSETLLHNIPIVALTANAIIGEETKCLEAGMDGYLFKPLDKGALETMLKKFLKEKQPLIDMSKIEQFEELQIDGLPDILIETIDSFFRTSPQRVKIILDSASRNDLEGTSREAHALKSSAFTLGAMTLGNVCQSIENFKNTENQTALQSLAGELESLYQQTCEELKIIKLGREQKTLTPNPEKLVRDT